MQKSESELEASASKAADILVSITMNGAQWAAVYAACQVINKQFKASGRTGISFSTLDDAMASMSSQMTRK